MIDKPLMLQGEIMHHRFFPKENSFKYNSCYIAFPAQTPNLLNKVLFTLNKFNLFSLQKSDYGAGDKHNLTAQLDTMLKEYGINNISTTILVTHPRLLGYAFNPVSFWLCFDTNKNLIATLSEVTNTCKQKHNYLCFKENYAPIKPSEWIEAKKDFYVSPFMKIEGYYKFRFEITDSQFNFFINYFVDNKLKLATYLKCKAQKFSNKNLLLSFLKVPFFTLKTTLLIYYQAAKLYLKSIQYYPYPKKLKQNLTVSKNGK